MDNRKPSGFWTKDQVVKDLMTTYVNGEADLADVADALHSYCVKLGVVQPIEAISADVTWYARGIRKELGLPSLKETKAAIKAQTEIAEQAV